MKFSFTRYLMCLLLLCTAGCASNVSMDSDSSTQVYKYKGEKYSKINVTWVDALGSDPDKVTRIQQLSLDKAIVNSLISQKIYDEQANNTIDVQVTDMRFRSAFNAIMWGAMSGADYVDGDVTLKATDGTPLAHFKISASYALGGFAGGPDGTRMSWLSGKFGELTAATILDKNQPQEKEAGTQ